MPLPRPCNMCEIKFKPFTKHTLLCKYCYYKTRKQKELRQKIIKLLDYLNVSSALPYSQSDIYKLIIIRDRMKKSTKKLAREMKIETTIDLTPKQFEKFIKDNPKLFKDYVKKMKGGH